MLERPANRALAAQFYRERQRRSVVSHRDVAVGLYAEAMYQTDFWLRRSPAGTNPDEVASPALPMDLRPETVFGLDPRVQFREVPIVKDSFVTNATAVTAPHIPEPLVFVNGVEVTPLIQMLNRPMRCDQILAAWAPSIGPRMALRILRVALANNCLLVLHANVSESLIRGPQRAGAPGSVRKSRRRTQELRLLDSRAGRGQ